MAPTQRRFSTGLQFLDKRIDGGFEAGGLLAFLAPPASQGELLLREFALARTTRYMSTTRPPDEIRDWLDRGSSPPTDITVERHTPSTALEDVETVLADLAPESFVIIDPVTGFEEYPRETYLDFLNGVKRRLRETDSVGILHCLDIPTPPPQRGLTLNRVDQVWHLQVLPLSRSIKSQLLIKKARNTRALTEPIDLLLTDRVRIDTSRRIA